MQFLAGLIAGLLMFGLALACSLLTLRHVPSAPMWLQVSVTLCPLIPGLLVCSIVLGEVKGLDELQRRVQIEALAFAFVGTAFLTMAYSFLEIVGFPKLSMFAVWPLMGALWFLASILASRRYR